MSIRFSKFIQITSSVGGAAQVPQRLWCARVYTTNPLVAPGSILQFSGQGFAAGVGALFGTSSEEYNRAVSYAAYVFGGKQPQAIQFARWVQADQPATIYGEANAAVLTALQAITTGALAFQFGATTVNITGISLSGAASLTAVATTLQTAIRAAVGAPNAELSTATVTWNATTQSFNFSASPTGVVTESFNVLAPGAGQDLANALGWYASQGAIVGGAQVAESRVAGYNRVWSINNNFGEFCYTDASALTLPDAQAVATANAANNVAAIFRVYVTPALWATWQAALINTAMVGLEYEDLAAIGGVRQYIEMLPMAVHASIDFDAVNGAVGFMYKQGAYTPSVTTDTLSDSLDAGRVNYYGQTQSAGANISFYQRGVLCGGATAPVDSTVAANEMSFKDNVGSGLMNLQLSVGQIPANKRGQAMCDSIVNGQAATAQTPASGIQRALRNGTISAGKQITSTQQAYITSVTGDATAWQQVANLGYWFSSSLSSAVSGGVTNWTYNYTIIYAKDDVVKTIVGSHQLI